MATTIKKPQVSVEEALRFATGDVLTKADRTIVKPRETALRATRTVNIGAGSPKRKPRGGKSGLVPEGYTRLTANIPADLHTKLKVKAATEGRSVVDILETLLSKHL